MRDIGSARLRLHKALGTCRDGELGQLIRPFAAQKDAVVAHHRRVRDSRLSDEPRDVHAAREGERDVAILAAVDPSRPDPECAQTRAPVPLGERRQVDRLALGVDEHRGGRLDVQGLDRLQLAYGLGQQLKTSRRSSRLRCGIFARIARAPYAKESSLEVDVAPRER